MWIDSLKTDKPCKDCGNVFPPICMDFDHVKSGKLFNISAAGFKGLGKERILEEISKCELVCSNCHRLRGEVRRKIGLSSNGKTSRSDRENQGSNPCNPAKAERASVVIARV